MTEMHEFSQQPLVLIVDDQSSNRSIVRRYVEAAGYLAAEAEHGVAALDFVRQTPPDAILLDIFMPGIDGIEVLKTIRAQRDHHYIPIIVVTAAAELAVRQQAYFEGADDFLLKPVDSATLRARLRAAIRLKHVLSRVEAERERFALIADITRDITQIESISGMLAHVVDVSTKALQADHGNLFLLHDVADVEILTTDDGVSHNLDRVKRVVKEGAAGYALRSRETVRIADVHEDARWLQLDQSAASVRSALIVPIGDASGPLGVLAVYHSVVDHFSADDQALLELIAHQIIGPIRQAQMREQLARQTRQLQLVNNLAQSLSANLDLDSLYRSIEQELQQIMGPVAIAWYSYRNAIIDLAYTSQQQAFCMPNDQQSLHLLTELGTITRVYSCVLGTDTLVPITQQLLDAGYQGCAAVPLLHQARLLGVLIIAIKHRNITNEEVALLEMARPHFAVALANAQTVADQAARQTEQAELGYLRNMAQLAGQMAHHFNNLLAVILGNTQLAELDAIDEGQRELLAEVVKHVRGGKEMVQRIHLLKGASRISPAPFPIDLSDALPSLIDQALQIHRSVEHLQLEIEPNLHILLQERELLTLCTELLNNALESGSSHAGIVIKAYQTEHATVLAFRDAGQGIPVDALGDIWQPFWTTHGPQRLGLGLPICAAVMWRASGSISLIPNDPEPGITALLQFPLLPSEAANSA